MPPADPDEPRLFRRYLPLVRGRARRIVGSPAVADDLAQQTFMNFFAQRRAGARIEDEAAFLFRTVSNLALNLLRDGRRRAELLALVPAPAPAAADLDERLAVRELLGRVPPEEAEIAACYYCDGMEQEEIGRLLGLPRRTVSRRLASFHAHARALLDGASPKVEQVEPHG